MRPKPALVIVAFLAAACGSPGVTAAPTNPSPSPTVASPSATTSPSLSAPATASPGASVAVSTGGPLPSGPIGPGDYTATVTGSMMTFTVGSSGWSADTMPDGWAVIDDSLQGALSVVTFVGKVYSEPCSGDKVSSVARSAATFIGQIEKNKELKVGKRVTTKLAGHAAIQVDLTADVPPACPSSPRIWLWVMGPSGDFHLDENESARIIAADVGDKTFVAVLETVQGGDQAGLIAKTQPILDSLAIQ